MIGLCLSQSCSRCLRIRLSTAFVYASIYAWDRRNRCFVLTSKRLVRSMVPSRCPRLGQDPGSAPTRGTSPRGSISRRFGGPMVEGINSC
jgi:hypothetical protein